MKKFLYLLLLSFSTSVFADDSLGSIFNPDAVASGTDTSIFMLSSILGPAIGSLVLEAGAPVQSILVSIIEKLNYIMVVVGMGIAGYVSVISIANTAQEGTIMGKKWSAVWIPMRSIAGLGMMIPSPGSGYSMIQTTVMWVVMNGIGAADTLWNIVMQGLSSGMSTVGGAKLPATANTTSQKLARDLLNANVCMLTLKKLAQMPAPVDLSTPEGLLYTAINGTNGQPSGAGRALLNYADSLTMYTATPSMPAVGDSSEAKYGSKVISSDPDKGIVYTDDNNNKSTVRKLATYNFGVKNGDQNWANICGSVDSNAYISTVDYSSGQIPGPDDVKHNLETVADVTYNVFASINDLMNTLANSIVNNAVRPRDFILSGSGGNAHDPSNYTLLSAQVTKDTLSPNGYFDIAMQSFNQNIISGGVIPSTDNDPNSIINQTIALGKKQGWITASSFYMVLAQNSAATIKIYYSLSQDNPNLFRTNVPSCTNTQTNSDLNTLGCQNNVYSNNDNNGTPYRYKGNFGTNNTNLTNVFNSSMDNYEYVLGFIAMYLAQVTKYVSVDGNLPGNNISINPSPGDIAQQVLNTGLNSGGPLSNANVIMSTANIMKSYGADPILSHAQLGYNMMVGAETSFSVLGTVLGLSALGVGVSASEFFGSSSRAAQVPWSTVILPLTLGIVLPVLLVTWTMGASLFMYVPLIPFMIFIVTAVGWLISVIEAIVAAPILALALVAPSNDELGRLTHGLGLLANLFLKPSLMILGFLFASKLYAGAIELVNWGMAENYSLLNQSTMLSWMAALGIYISFVLTLANKCFALIYVLPDKVMRWLGVNGDSTDASEELGAAKRGQEGANKAGDTVASGIGQTGGKIAEKKAKAEDNAAKNKSSSQG